MAAKKIVLKLLIHDDKEKQKAMKAVSSFPGVESLAIDMKEKKLTVVGDVDPVQVVTKLRESWHTEILTVGPAKTPEKKSEDGKDSEQIALVKLYKAEEDGKKKEREQIAGLLKLYKNFNPYYTQYYHVYSAKENPNSSERLS